MADGIWRHDLATGIPEIDAQHQVLFQAVQELQASLQRDAPATDQEARLAFLAQYTIDHFQTEETLMKACCFPTRAAHAAQHQELILQIRDLQYQLLKGRPLPRDLAAFLSAWLDHHVREVDMDYVVYLRERNAS